MARLAILTVVLLLMAGLVIEGSDSNDYPDFEDSSDTTPEPNTITTTNTTTTKTTTTTTTPTTTSTTTTKTKPTNTTTTTTKTTPTTTNATTTKPTNTTTITTTTTTPSNTTNTTTTPTTTTTITTTETTTLKPTPPPEEKYDYNVTSGKVVCIMFEGTITFAIEYDDAKGKENKTVNVTSPAHPQKGYDFNGTCGDSQSLTFKWGESGKGRNTTLKFARSKDKKTWWLQSVEAMIFLDSETFPDAVDINKTLEITALYTLDPTKVAVNSSFSCINPTVTTSNVTGLIDKKNYTLDITSSMNSVKLQAYNEVANVTKFGKAMSCAGDLTVNNIIPIVVGCALGGLVVIVLIAYVVGRRRNAAANESTA